MTRLALIISLALTSLQLMAQEASKIKNISCNLQRFGSEESPVVLLGSVRVELDASESLYLFTDGTSFESKVFKSQKDGSRTEEEYEYRNSNSFNGKTAYRLDEITYPDQKEPTNDYILNVYKFENDQWNSVQEISSVYVTINKGMAFYYTNHHNGVSVGCAHVE